ncbi:MAG: GFA family protein [Sneathiella sp.]
MINSLKGGCACGAIRFEISGNPEFSIQCHCRKCQRATGGGHSSIIAFASEGVTFTGEIKQFPQNSDIGSITYSGFCSNCGSPLTSKTERFPDRLYIHAATFDDPSKFKANMVVFENEAQPWDKPATIE